MLLYVLKELVTKGLFCVMPIYALPLSCVRSLMSKTIAKISFYDIFRKIPCVRSLMSKTIAKISFYDIFRKIPSQHI